MKNLKRVLSMALASVMLIGTMVVANAVDFTDAEEITHDDAVNFAIALNIIKGNDDGSFAPERNVTRGEMAKMITIALNGGEEPVLGVQTTPAYSDIGNHWARKYIEYCSNLGIIAGNGDGTFNPDGNVTGTQAAKMLLVAMGYNAEIRGYVGADWDLNINVDANSTQPNKLYAGIESIDPAKELSRDNAAQMIFNAVQDYMMVRSDSLTIQNGQIQYSYGLADGNGAFKEMTILSEKYGYKVRYGYMIGASYEADEDKYEYHLDSAANMGGGKIIEAEGGFLANGTTGNNGYVTFTEDVSDLYGQRVKVIYKPVNGKNVAVGIYAANPNAVLTSGVVGNISAALNGEAADKALVSTKINGTTYRFDGDGDGTDNKAEKVVVYSHLAGTMKAADTTTAINLATIHDAGNTITSTAMNEYSMKVIDNDNDGRINCIVVTPVKVGKITYLGSETITISGVAGGLKVTDDVDLYEGAKKGDWVVVTDKANCVNHDKHTVVLAETLTSTIGAVNTDSDHGIRMDGTWYKIAQSTVSGSKVPTKADLNKDADIVILNGYYVNLALNKAISNDLAIITYLGNAESFDDVYAARIAFTDGSTKTTRVQLATGAPYDTTPGKPYEGLFYTYELGDDGVYVLDTANSSTTGYDGAVDKTFQYVADDKNIASGSNTMFVDDEAIVIVLHDDGDNTHAEADYNAVADSTNKLKSLKTVSFITGAQLKKWSDGDSGSSWKFGGNAYTQGFYTEVNGLKYTQVLFLAFDADELPGAGGTTKYGYVVSDSYREKVDGKYITYFDLWTGSETISVQHKGAIYPSQGTMVSYTDQGDGVVKILNVNGSGAITALITDAADTGKGAIIGYNAGDETVSILVGYNSTVGTYTLDEKTIIRYVDTKNKIGVQSEGIPLATVLPDGSYEQNAMIITSGTSPKHVDVIFIDVNNKISGSAAVAPLAATPNAASAEVKAEDIRKLADGVYQPTTATKSSTDLTGSWTDQKDLLIFKWTNVAASSTSKTFTLNIKDSKGTVKYTEDGTLATTAANTGYFFYVWTDSTSGKWKTAANDTVYNYEILDDGVVVGSGTFTYKTPA